MTVTEMFFDRLLSIERRLEALENAAGLNLVVNTDGLAPPIKPVVDEIREFLEDEEEEN